MSIQIPSDDVDDRPCDDLACGAWRYGLHWHWPAWGVLATKGDVWAARMMFTWWPQSRAGHRGGRR